MFEISIEPRSRQSSATESGKRIPLSGKADRYVDLVIEEETKKRRVVNLEASPLEPAFENLKHSVNLRYLNLSNNSSIIHVGLLETIPHLKNLFKLDLSGNKLMTLPDQNFFAKFPSLQILYLHENNLSSEKSFHSLAPL